MDSDDTRSLTRSAATLPRRLAQLALWLWMLLVLAIAGVVYDLPRIWHVPLHAAVKKAVWWFVMPYSER
jgi:hypothetical protein